MKAFQASKLLATLFLSSLAISHLGGVNLVAVSSAAQAAYSIHKVSQGDTLSSIARKYHTNVGVLLELNKISNKDALRPGQEIKVPRTGELVQGAKKTSAQTSTPQKALKTKRQPATAQQTTTERTYVVQSGDNLNRIAKRFQVTKDRLIAVNKLKDPDAIRQGQKLKLPPEAKLPAEAKPNSVVVLTQPQAIQVPPAPVKQAHPVLVQPEPVAKLEAVVKPELKVSEGIDLPPAEEPQVEMQEVQVAQKLPAKASESLEQISQSAQAAEEQPLDLSNLPPAVREQIALAEEAAKAKTSQPAKAAPANAVPAQADKDVKDAKDAQAKQPEKQKSQQVPSASPQVATVANPEGFDFARLSKYTCAPDALAVGIKHFRFPEVKKAYLVHSGYGDKANPKFQIHRDAKQALTKMVQAAKKAKVRLEPGSIFRGVNRQAQIVRGKKAQGQAPEQIYFTSSHPGFSEHHTGLAVDFLPIDHSFAKTPAYKWLEEHAGEFGFKRTFTEEYSEASGVSWESWHWRYEGVNGEFKFLFAESDAKLCQVPDDQLKKLQAEFAKKREAKKAPQAKKDGAKAGKDKSAKNAKPTASTDAKPKSQPANAANTPNSADADKATKETAAKDAVKPQNQPTVEEPKK